MSESPKCPNCGLTMCAIFQDIPSEYKGLTYAVPTGEYICYHCEDLKKAAGKGKP